MDASKIIISMLTGILFHLPLFAQQARIAVSRDRILIGEQFELTIKLDAGTKGMVSFPVLPDSVNHLEVIKRSNVDSVRSGGRQSYTQVLTMTGFEPGQWTIPSVVFRVNGKNIRSDSARVNVIAVPLRGNDYNDIKDIKDVQDTGFAWEKILIALGGALIIGLLAYYWWKRRKDKPVMAKPVSRSGAYEEAMESLKRLKDERADQKGEMKLYYSALYDIFRVFLSRVTDKPAMQYTTDELILTTKDLLAPATFSTVAEVFRITDAVKFAKYGSGLQESSDSLERIRQGIDEVNRQKR
jgi:LPXTG-motif cell wall-anchored protein